MSSRAQVHPTPVQRQPGGGDGGTSWAPRPTAGPAICPPGLEYLAQVDQILVCQVVEMLEAFTGWETINRYRVLNSMGQQCYYAFEESNVAARQFLGKSRGFTIKIVDNYNKEVMRIHRPYRGSWGGQSACCTGCTPEVRIEAPPGTTIGYVVSDCFYYTPSFQILDADRLPAFSIQGPCLFCAGCCGEDVNFYVHDAGESTKNPQTAVGRISKQWSGFAQELFTDAQNFGISFPQDMDVRMKGVLMGALFLIDFMFFEDDDGIYRWLS